MNDVGAGVMETICRTFGCGPERVTRETQADDIDGWDSLSHAVLLVSIEKRFGFRLDAARAFEVQNVGELIDLVLATRAGAGA